MQDRLISTLQQSSIRISKAKTNLENTVQHKNGIIADLQKIIKDHQNEISNKTLTEKVDEEEFDWDEFDYNIYYNSSLVKIRQIWPEPPKNCNILFDG